MGSSMELGGGGRFKAFASKVEGEGYSAGAAKAIAASAGRKKYGKKRMQKFAAKGRAKRR
jgi:hypothetical protein